MKELNLIQQTQNIFLRINHKDVVLNKTFIRDFTLKRIQGFFKKDTEK